MLELIVNIYGFTYSSINMWNPSHCISLNEIDLKQIYCLYSGLNWGMAYASL